MNQESDVNLLARFLAHQQVGDLSTCPNVDCIVICASAVLHQATALFRALESRPSLAKTLVLCGGIGHSTPLIYEAVARHPTYSSLAKEADGLPEARVLQLILERHFHVSAITGGGCRILVEDSSTNCGANARESKKVLERDGAVAPKTLVIVQDPTMALRTAAAFEKAYAGSDAVPRIVSFPVFVPQVRANSDDLEFVVEDAEVSELWEMRRFLDLLMGELPRLKRYGPDGTGDIARVVIPANAEEAHVRLSGELKTER